MKKLFITWILLGAIDAHAQQDPIYAQYLNAPLLINPAYAGFSRDLNFAFNYRKQWAGFAGSPQTFSALGHVALRNNKMGAGLMALQDKIGANRTTEVQGVYAYHLPIADEAVVSFGLQVGAINYQSDYSELVINPNDPKFNRSNEWQPNFGAGAIVTNDRYYFSISSTKMLNANGEVARLGLYQRNLYLLGAYTFVISPRLRLKPFAMLRNASAQKSSYDLGANLLGDDSYVIGVFTRSFHTYGFSGQLKLDELIRIGYVFELPTQQSAGLSYTSHEIQLIIRWVAASFHDVGAVKNY